MVYAYRIEGNSLAKRKIFCWVAMHELCLLLLLLR
jgi:hypothetical protein